MKTVLMLTQRESPAFRAIADGVSDAARRRGWSLHVATAPDVRRGAGLVASWHCDGCIVYAARPNGLSGDLSKLRVATVCISPALPPSNVHYIAHDSFATGELAARGLAALGLDSFAFAAEDVRLRWVRQRLAGFRREMKSRGRDVSVFGGGNLRDWLHSLPKPCGIFAANDETAEKVVSAANSEGIAIPSSIAVLGCDDDARICENAEVTISSIRPDYRSCGELATATLESAMEKGGHRPQSHVFGDEGITRRASTRLLAEQSPEIVRALEFIRLNAFAGTTPEGVLARMKGSRRRAEVAFRKATGHSILDELHDVRLAEAKRLLANPSVKIGSIASRVGYGSENFFARIFKRDVGVTMREFRRRAKRNAPR